jgi:mRNA interferase MazF
MPGKCTRGMILDVNLNPTIGHEQRKTRPCLVVQNDIGNANSSTTIVVPLTSAENIKRFYPVHVRIPAGHAGLAKESVALCNQIRTVDEVRFGKVYGKLSGSMMQEVNRALKISLGIY